MEANSNPTIDQSLLHRRKKMVEVIPSSGSEVHGERIHFSDELPRNVPHKMYPTIFDIGMWVVGWTVQPKDLKTPFG